MNIIIGIIIVIYSLFILTGLTHAVFEPMTKFWVRWCNVIMTVTAILTSIILVTVVVYAVTSINI